MNNLKDLKPPTKTLLTITIEREFYKENGIPMIKRIVKKDNVTLYEGIIKASFESYPSKLDDFIKWIDDIINPKEKEIECRLIGVFTYYTPDIVELSNENEYSFGPRIINPSLDYFLQNRRELIRIE